MVIVGDSNKSKMAAAAMWKNHKIAISPQRFDRFFTAQHYASAVYTIAFYLSVTSRCSAKTATCRITQTTPYNRDSKLWMAVHFSALLCGNWQDFYWHDALRGLSAIAELLVTRIVGLMAEHEIHVVLVSVQHHSVPGRMTWKSCCTGCT